MTSKEQRQAQAGARQTEGRGTARAGGWEEATPAAFSLSY